MARKRKSHAHTMLHINQWASQVLLGRFCYLLWAPYKRNKAAAIHLTHTEPFLAVWNIKGEANTRRRNRFHAPHMCSLNKWEPVTWKNGVMVIGWLPSLVSQWFCRRLQHVASRKLLLIWRILVTPISPLLFLQLCVHVCVRVCVCAYMCARIRVRQRWDVSTIWVHLSGYMMFVSGWLKGVSVVPYDSPRTWFKALPGVNRALWSLLSHPSHRGDGVERIGGASCTVFTFCHSLSSVDLAGNELLSAIRGTSFLLSLPNPLYIHCLATERMHCAI